jgi:hypothetical protein
MPLSFGTLLRDANLDPKGVRLLRHQVSKGRSPYTAWRDDRSAFETYQSIQRAGRRGYFDGQYWASFVAAPAAKTLFVGIYKARLAGPVLDGIIDPLGGASLSPISHDQYETTLAYPLSEFVGRLYVDWGGSARAWVQRADRQDKIITEIHASFQEPEFPGFSRFKRQLSEMEALPAQWVAVLQSARGIYLLTCPKTREQYVGSAMGEDGFWGRWQSYFGGGHGGNVGLKSRDPSDYQVSILEIAGSAATALEILQLEQLWKEKLQSREMGLNRN